MLEKSFFFINRIRCLINTSVINLYKNSRVEEYNLYIIVYSLYHI